MNRGDITMCNTSATTAGIAATAQKYKWIYQIMDPACGTVMLTVEEYNVCTLARPQPQSKQLDHYTIVTLCRIKLEDC